LLAKDKAFAKDKDVADDDLNRPDLLDLEEFPPLLLLLFE
jgi:hypothetical protein